MKNRIAIFGGSFDPPGVHHRAIAKALVKEFDKVVVVPCGPRPDKKSANNIDPTHRASMCDMAFRGNLNIEVDLFDLEQATFTRTHNLEIRYESRGEIYHVVGSDLVIGGRDGKSQIQRQWKHGKKIWKDLNFAVVLRDGYDLNPDDLPPHSVVISPKYPGSSSEIRERVFKNLLIDGLVTPEIKAYIERYSLYTGRSAPRTTRYNYTPDKGLQVHVVVDRGNPRARKIVKKFKSVPLRNADIIVVSGGDGFMLECIRKYWRYRLPILGVNTGHYGYLLNNINDVLGSRHPEYTDYRIHQLPLLYVEAEDTFGNIWAMYGFNDAWLERSRGKNRPVRVSKNGVWITHKCSPLQTAHTQIKIDGQVRMERYRGDGILVSTAAGSTGYAVNAGATPQVATAHELVLTALGGRLSLPLVSGPISINSTVELTVLEPYRRAQQAVIDSYLLTPKARKMRIRRSHVASVEIMMHPGRDLAEKHAQMMFGNGR